MTSGSGANAAGWLIITLFVIAAMCATGIVFSFLLCVFVALSS